MSTKELWIPKQHAMSVAISIGLTSLYYIRFLFFISLIWVFVLIFPKQVYSPKIIPTMHPNLIYMISIEMKITDRSRKFYISVKTSLDRFTVYVFRWAPPSENNTSQTFSRFSTQILLLANGFTTKNGSLRRISLLN